MSIVGFDIYMSSVNGEESYYYWEPISKLPRYNWIFRNIDSRERDNQSGLCLVFTYEKWIPSSTTSGS